MNVWKLVGIRPFHSSPPPPPSAPFVFTYHYDTDCCLSCQRFKDSLVHSVRQHSETGLGIGQCALALLAEDLRLSRQTLVSLLSLLSPEANSD